MTESTWKILKLDWKTPGIFFFQKSGNPDSSWGISQTVARVSWLLCMSAENFFCIWCWQVLYSIHTMLRKKETVITDGQCHADRMLLHVCSLTKKYPCVWTTGIFCLRSTASGFTLLVGWQDVCPACRKTCATSPQLATSPVDPFMGVLHCSLSLPFLLSFSLPSYSQQGCGQPRSHIVLLPDCYSSI